MAPGLRVGLHVPDAIFATPIGRAIAHVSAFGASIAEVGLALTALSTPWVVLFGSAALAWKEHAAALRTVRISTGATGDCLESLGAAFQAVRLATRASTAEAAAVVSELAKRLNLVGPDLVAASTAAAKLARAGGTDLQSTAVAVARAMAAWGVPAAQVAETTAGLQSAARLATGGAIGLADQLAISAPAFRAAGMSMGATANTLADLGKYGISAEPAIQGITKSASVLAQSGVTDISGALRDRVATIRSAPTAAGAAQIAVTLFGESGLRMADAMRSGALAFDEMKKRPLGAVATKTLTAAFEDLYIRTSQALLPLGKAVMRISAPLTSAMVEAMGYLIDLCGLAARAFGSLPGSVQSVIVIMGFVAVLAVSAVIFGGTVITVVATALAATVKTMGILGILATALGILSAGAVTAWITSGATLAAALPKAGGPRIIPALVAAGVTLGGVMAGATVPAAERVQEQGTTAFFESTQAEPLLALIPPALPVLEQPVIKSPDAFEPPALEGFDWQKQVVTQLEKTAIIGGGAPPMPAYAPAPGRSAYAAMLEQSGAMARWYGELAAAGFPPFGLSSSWLATAAPTFWAERAETQGLWIDEQENRERFMVDWISAKNAADVITWGPSSTAPISSDQFEAGQQGWERSVDLVIGGSASSHVMTSDELMSAVIQGIQAVGAA